MYIAGVLAKEMVDHMIDRMNGRSETKLAYLYSGVSIPLTLSLSHMFLTSSSTKQIIYSVFQTQKSRGG